MEGKLTPVFASPYASQGKGQFNSSPWNKPVESSRQGPPRHTQKSNNHVDIARRGGRRAFSCSSVLELPFLAFHWKEKWVMAARLAHVRDQGAADMNSCQASWHKDLIIIHKNAWARLGGLGPPPLTPNPVL